MVGIQGSGKSTHAKQLAPIYDAVVLSSDEIRKDNPSLNNGQVFEYLYAQMNNYLSQNKSVIIDATNTTIKSRKTIFERLKYMPDTIDACVMCTEYDECLRRVEIRNTDPNEHYVPLEAVRDDKNKVINKQTDKINKLKEELKAKETLNQIFKDNRETKISFAVEQLEKVKEYIHGKYLDETWHNKIVDEDREDTHDFIDNQIKQLKEGK